MSEKKKETKEKIVDENLDAQAGVEPMESEPKQDPENKPDGQDPVNPPDPEAEASESRTCLTCRLLQTFEHDDKKGFCPKLDISIKLKKPKKNCEYWRMPV